MKIYVVCPVVYCAIYMIGLLWLNPVSAVLYCLLLNMVVGIMPSTRLDVCWSDIDETET